MFRPSFLTLVVAIGFLTCTWHNSAAAQPGSVPAEGAAAASVDAEPAPGPGVATVAPLVPEPVGRLMQDRKYTEAVEAIDEALKADDAFTDYLLYLKARALHLDEKYDEAIAAFDRVTADHAEGDWARRARFGKAMSLARKGDFQAAQAIVQAEAEYLLSPDRKQAIAEVYLEFADHHFNPPKNEQREPDFQKALDFYQRALEAGPKPAKRAEVELLAARCLQQLGKLDEAVAAYERFIAEYADSPLDVEARYRLGECRLAQGALKPARRVWQDLLAKHVDAQHELIAEAALNLARTWNLPEPNSDEDLNLGTAALEAFLERFPAHARAGEAHLDVARSFMHRGRYASAANVLERFLADERYRDREEAAGARGLLGTAYQLQKKYAEAMAAWQDYLARHPAHGAWREVQRQMIDTEYLLGAEKYGEKEYAEARRLWSAFMDKYPLDDRCPKILYLFGQMHFNEQQWEEAVAAWRAVVAKYPGTDQSSIAQYRIGQALEEKLGKLEEALEEYKKVTWGHHQHAARQAATRLLAWSLRLATERIYRSDETPKLTLATRNLEAVSIRAYKVDLETYFRKMHAARGVEGLDVALIDPDAVLEHAVPGYARFQEIESLADVPLPDALTAGAMAVTVTGQTLEATTLVIQSDLDIVVKSSRGEVFVFAQNMLTGKPWPGVRLLLSDGERVIAEETTGPDGTFRGSYEVLKETENPVVSVFAMAEGGHIASNRDDLAGVDVAQGLTDKGYIYTDRPAYRAGQWVHVRGCLRAVRDDRYVVDEDKAYTLEVFDARDRLVHRADVTLGPWGSFHDRFLLPPAGPQGQYRVLVSDVDGRSYQGTFQVQEYRLEPVQLVIDAPRAVYYRGEEIEGVIRAAYYYGAPLAGREIRYQLADERLHTATTDENGEVAFKLPTREFGETQVLPLMVALPERNVTTSRNFVLSAQGFSLRLGSVRPVYIAGETFEVTVAARDAEGKPIAEPLSLKVFEKTTVQGRVGERLVEEHAIETSEPDGTARHTLQIDRGGQYVVRAEGTDRFHNPISGEYAVQISDRDDDVRLRILADRHTLTVGETAAVRLHWREAPALALVTFEGAGILDYRLVELEQGENVLELPVTADLAPNFDLAVAVMIDPRGDWSVFRPTTHDTEAKPQAENTDLSPSAPTRAPSRFHTASSPFGVERELKVSLSIGNEEKNGEEGEAGAGAGTPKRELQHSEDAADARPVLRPGEEVEVTVTTTDPLGNPVAAELSLAMVEQSLLDRFAWPDPIGGYFRGVPRTSGVNTTSSITFKYYPATQPISPRLLAERDRLELAEEEAESLEATRLAMAAGQPKSMGGNRAAAAADKPSAPEDPFGQPADEPFAQPADDPTETADPFAAEDARQERLTTKARELDQLKRTSDSREDGFWSQLDSVDHSAVGFDDRHPIHFRHAWDEITARRQLLARDGMPTDPPAEPIHETGYWNPAIVTGEDGRATVTFTVPDRSTAWQLMAKGITADTLAGEAAENLTVKKDLFGQLKLPLGFTDGDKARIEAAVHNDVLPEGRIDVVLATTIGGRTVEERKTLEVNAKGIEELAFDVDLTRPAAPDADASEPAPQVDVLFELTVAAGGVTDVVRSTVPLRPFGAPVYATAAGSAAADTTAWVAPPEGMAFERPGLQILIGPSVEQSLLDIVLAPAPWCQAEAARFTAGLESATSDLMAALGLMRLLAGTREAGGPQADALDTRVRSTIGLLVAAQNDDGGWSWTGRAGASDGYVSARAVWVLALARKAGFHVPDACHDKAVTYLQTQTAAAAETDYEGRAILLHALAAAGQGDFALANRLYRNRPALAPVALAYLALAFAEMDRKPVAQELADLLAQQDLDAPPARRPAGQGAPAWNCAPVELRALYALVLEQVAPGSKAHEETVERLMAQRIGHRWSPDKATGPAALAVCAWYARSRFEGERYRLGIVVNDEEAAVLEVDSAAGTLVVNVPSRLLKPDGQRIRFHLTGRGRYTYQCILGGFVPAEKLAGTTQDWRVERHYQPAPLEFDGRDVPRGFGGLTGSYSIFRNPLTELPVGRRGVVELEVWRNNTDAKYLVVTEPIPSGATVIERSVQGPFERFELTPEGITFYIGSRPSIGTIRYELYGYLPGEYRAAPTIVRDAHRPEQIAVSAPKPLKVLPAGVESADPYRLTPQELFELGKLHFAKGDMPAAGRHLTELVEKWNLNADVYRQTVEMLLDVHLETGPAAQVVRWFEVVKERWPSVEIPFDKIVKVGEAYREMGEFERSYLVFRATVESSFMREARVAGFLQSQGEFARSVEVMARLLREYPPEGYVAAANYALAQGVYAKAPEAAGDPALRKAGLNRVELTRRAWSMLEAFLTEYPDDPAADQAAFAAASTLLDLERFDDAAGACARYAERYPKSELLDSFWYMIGYCRFATGEHEAALEMCRKVAEAKRTDPRTGRVEEARNKWRAIFILGQIHHSLGEAAAAIDEYRRVEDRFPDARQSIEYFTRKAIEMPEVTTISPENILRALNVSAPLEVTARAMGKEYPGIELTFRNIAACDVKVYRIDLMTFTLLRRDLEGIAQINLSGIRPYYEATIELGDGNDYRDRTHVLHWGSIAQRRMEEGAYLVVCRGDDLYTSGMVLVTPLAVEVQEDAVSGRVRTTVKHSGEDRYLRGVHVKVIGSANDDFVAGQTDLRGVFVADGILGTSTVIAQADGPRYAFFRGRTPLAPAEAKPAQAPGAQAAPAQPSGELLEGLRDENIRFQHEQVEQLQELYENVKGGVEASVAF